MTVVLMNEAQRPLAEREREYSPSSAIGGDYQPFIQRYQTQSASARSQHTAGWRDVAWGQGAAQQVSVWLPPQAKTPPPLLVFIHGGYWQELGRVDSLFAASACMEQGFAFAALDYTLAPKATVQEIALECRQALRWLHAQAADWGFDAQRMVVAGSSAGAHLTAMSCLRDWPHDADLPAGLPAAAVLVSGVYELAPLMGTSIDQALGLTPERCEAISPLRHTHFAPIPYAIFWGENETEAFKRQSQVFSEHLKMQGLSVTHTTEVPLRNHFDVILDLAERSTVLGSATVDLLTR